MTVEIVGGCWAGVGAQIGVGGLASVRVIVGDARPRPRAIECCGGGGGGGRSWVVGQGTTGAALVAQVVAVVVVGTPPPARRR